MILATITELEGQGSQIGSMSDYALSVMHQHPRDKCDQLKVDDKTTKCMSTDTSLPVPVEEKGKGKAENFNEGRIFSNKNGDSMPLKIRIKIYSSWEKKKFTSLSAVRLYVRNSDMFIPLSEFSIRVRFKQCCFKIIVYYYVCFTFNQKKLVRYYI